MSNFLRKLFGSSESKTHPLEAGVRHTPFEPSPDVSREQPAPISPRVMAIVHNPVMQAHGARKIKDVYGWNDPDLLAQGYIDDIRHASYGYVNYQIVEHIQVNAFPLKKDGFCYTDESFSRAWQQRHFHQPDAVDYLELVHEFSMIEKVDSGEIDEVWLLGFPYCGYYESIMAGPGAFWCNAPPLEGTEHAARRFVIMGFNYERGVGEMLEDLGHRAESILSKVFERTAGDANLFERFLRYDRKYPGQAECGNVHFAPNSLKDYDWGNATRVPSRCDSWYNFPDLNGSPRMVDCSEWGSGDIRKHHVWWFRHFPHFIGESDGISWNWWEYVIDPNRVRTT
jgi:hypothetical protein